MDIGKSFSYVFEDQQWLRKVLIGGVINLIPIVGFAAIGYSLEQTRRVYEGRELPLPEWDAFGDYFRKGLVAFVGWFIYSLPLLVIACCAYLPLITADQRGRSPFGDLATPVLLCGACLVLLYTLFLIVILPAVTTKYALTEQLGSFFQIGAAWQMVQTNIGGYVMAVVVYLITYIIALTVGGIVCIGGAWTGFWASLVGAHLFGNFAKGAPVAPPVPATV